LSLNISSDDVNLFIWWISISKGVELIFYLLLEQENNYRSYISYLPYVFWIISYLLQLIKDNCKSLEMDRNYSLINRNLRFQLSIITSILSSTFKMLTCASWRLKLSEFKWMNKSERYAKLVNQKKSFTCLFNVFNDLC